MINPSVVEAIKDRREFEELRVHMREEAMKLDRVSDITGTGEEIAIETLARKRALEVIEAILKPFGIATQPQIDAQEHARKRHGLSTHGS